MSTTIANVTFVACTLEKHGPAMLKIINEVIENSTAIYDYQPRPASSMESWFKAKQDGGYPVIGVESPDDRLLGFATYGTFRAWPAYKYSAELSLYVRADKRGGGLGDQLLGRLVDAAVERDVHVLIAGIDATNGASIRLHEKHGFTRVGVVRECGFKFGGWLDLAFYQRILRTPRHPTDGL